MEFSARKKEFSALLGNFDPYFLLAKKYPLKLWIIRTLILVLLVAVLQRARTGFCVCLLVGLLVGCFIDSDMFKKIIFNYRMIQGEGEQKTKTKRFDL